MPLEDLIEPPRVRSLLDISLYVQPALLPDSVITDLLYSGMAATEIKQRVSGAEAKTGTDFHHVINALHLLTAALLAESGTLPDITSERDESGGGMTREPADWPNRGAKLRATAYGELAIGLGQTSNLPGARSSMRVGHRTVPCGLLRTLKNR